MALKTEYILRETGNNLRRNISLSIAAVVTVAVSLAMLGVALVAQKGVDQATRRWQDGVEFIVFMEPDSTASQLEQMETKLTDSTEVERFRFVDQDKAYEEFTELFPDGDVTDIVGPSDLPPSFRVVPVQADAARVGVLVETFGTEPGVRDVKAAADVIRKIEKAAQIARITVLIVGLGLLVTSGLLITNTIRMAMVARRREIEVMKLVGATNWFIRVPFMLEGLIQGLVGAGLAIGMVFGVNEGFRRWLSSDDSVNILQNFAVDNGFVWVVASILLALGTGIGALGSGIAVNRYVDV